VALEHRSRHAVTPSLISIARRCAGLGPVISRPCSWTTSGR
jgi:hypothetical protein